MNGDEFRAAITMLWGPAAQDGAGEFLDVGDRSIQRWCAGSAPIPPGVETALRAELRLALADPESVNPYVTIIRQVTGTLTAAL